MRDAQSEWKKCGTWKKLFKLNCIAFALFFYSYGSMHGDKINTKKKSYLNAFKINISNLINIGERERESFCGETTHNSWLSYLVEMTNWCWNWKLKLLELGVFERGSRELLKIQFTHWWRTNDLFHVLSVILI